LHIEPKDDLAQKINETPPLNATPESANQLLILDVVSETKTDAQADIEVIFFFGRSLLLLFFVAILSLLHGVIMRSRKGRGWGASIDGSGSKLDIHID
jgi:hypothetical protein